MAHPGEPLAVAKVSSDSLSAEGKPHFYLCEECGEMVDKRQLDDVLFHEDHKPRPDIPYSGSMSVEICPVCGAECVQEKCKVVCVSTQCIHRVVKNCSEF